MESRVESEDELEGRRTFAMLKPLCAQLLGTSPESRAVGAPKDHAVVLQSLHMVLTKVSTSGLQKCMDYVLFPLLLLLDAAVSGRSSSHLAKMQPVGVMNVVRIGGRVAEGVLTCMEIVLQRCVFETISQVTTLLQKLTYGAMLSQSEAPEEFRHGVLKCLQALLLNLKACDSPTCTCKSVSSSPFLALEENSVAFFTRDTKVPVQSNEHDEMNAECPLGYMQTKHMSAAVGHLMSLLLQIAEAEAARGATGSGKLRRDALSTVRAIITKVGTADGVAFFVPGVASGLAKVLVKANPSRAASLSPFASAVSHISGAAGWPAAVEESIKGITEILVIALGDANNAEICGPASVSSNLVDKHEALTAQTALASLKGRSPQLHLTKSDAPRETVVQLEQQSTALSVHQLANPEDGPPLRIPRTEEWMRITAVRVNALLEQAFPPLCNHHSPSVRLAVAQAVAILLANCGRSLRVCVTLFLECLLVLACDDWKHIACASQTYLYLLLARPLNVPPRKDVLEEDGPFNALRTDLVRISLRILDQLPKLALSKDSTLFVLRARQLASAMYFLGPDGVSAHLLDSLGAKQTFVRALSQCLSFNISFAGSLGRVVSGKPILLETISSDLASHPSDPDQSSKQQKEVLSRQMISAAQAERLPTMPPWLTHGSAEACYHALANILRLAGLSTVTDQTNGTSLVSLMELLLVNVRLAAMHIGNNMDMSTEDGGVNGREQRSAATSVCVLNEIIYGASGAWDEHHFLKVGNLVQTADKLSRADESPSLRTKQQMISEDEILSDAQGFFCLQSLQGRWQAADKSEVRKIISDCAGSILNDYLAAEVWDQPTDLASATFAHKAPVDAVSVNTIEDNVMLQKVLVDGVGILGIALGKDFEENGLLGVALFPMLEKLACSKLLVRNAAAVALNILCSYCRYTSVRELVVANVDLVIDSLCRQFRHLRTYGNAPNLLAAILRHTNASADLLPLLEEPLRSVVLELDVLARKDHPHLTIPLLRALREITRATRVEAEKLRDQAADSYLTCTSIFDPKANVLEVNPLEEPSKRPSATKIGSTPSDSDIEDFVIRLMDRRRCTLALGSIAGSCLIACEPLLASKDPQQCLLALDTLEDGIVTLSHTEATAGHEGKEKDCIQHLCNKLGFFQASENLSTAFEKDATNLNKLLPSMNQIWPHLVLCLRHAHTSIIIRALGVIVSATHECGGNFFVRRFQKDAVPLFVKLLQRGTTWFQMKPTSTRLLLPRNDALYEESAPLAVLKVQEAALKAISAIAERDQSSLAFAGSLDMIAAWVVVAACRVSTLREVAASAVMALAKMDPDLVWYLLVDLVHGGFKEESTLFSPPGFPLISKICPSCSSPADTLCIQYSRYDVELKILDKNVAYILLAKLEVLD